MPRPGGAEAPAQNRRADAAQGELGASPRKSARDLDRDARHGVPGPDRILSRGPLARHLRDTAPARRDNGYRYVDDLTGRRFNRTLGCWVR